VAVYNKTVVGTLLGDGHIEKNCISLSMLACVTAALLKEKMERASVCCPYQQQHTEAFSNVFFRAGWLAKGRAARAVTQAITV